MPMMIFYDASCRLCRAEIEAVKAHDAEGVLTLVDCSATGFDAQAFHLDGISREAMMQALHVRNEQGEWFVGADAFALIYRTLNMSLIAGLWGGRFFRPVSRRLYPWIARHRRLAVMTGLPALFEMWALRAARRAQQRSEGCKGGSCSL